MLMGSDRSCRFRFAVNKPCVMFMPITQEASLLFTLKPQPKAFHAAYVTAEIQFISRHVNKRNKFHSDLEREGVSFKMMIFGSLENHICQK